MQPAGGFTAFHYTCDSNPPECAEELAHASCDIRLKDSNGFTGRELAEAKGHAAVMEHYYGGGLLFSTAASARGARG
jgi:ankyrin repeat protein